MATLIKLGRRTCSARCYNAKHPHCSCLCGGENHSIGQEQAEKNVSRDADKYTEQGAQVKVLLPGMY